MPEQSPVTTFFFTDIEGSSRLWETDPSGMQPALAQHDGIVRSAVTRHRGTVVKMTGDGVCAVFGDPLDAVHAALDLQVALADAKTEHGLPLHARCGMHVGIGERRDNDYFGNAVNRAARIMSAAHGGQTLLSQAVVDLVRERLPADVALRDLGAVRLRDLSSPERIHQLLHPALREQFPPLRSLAATPNNLPQQVTSFVGRERELEEARRLLSASRLLTLHGAGGIGKTRLSLQLAAQVLDDYPDGVWLVELAPITDARLVPQAVASVLGVKEEAGHPVLDALLKYVGDLRALLILDNCEHVIGACAELADRVRAAAAQVRILATSREPLHVAGEVVYAMPALAFPDKTAPVDTLTEYEAVRLFAERSLAALPSFRLGANNAAHVIDICRQLDGIPLAIELAAARVRTLSVENIALRLADRFSLLTSGNRTALPRQQTLRALIDWSYDLLSDEERALFRRLAVFAGGFTLEAVESVAAGGIIGTGEVVDVLSGLVEKSVLAVEVDGDRYRLLETMRQYAQMRLDESGEGDAVRSRHLEYYLALVEKARPALAGPEQARSLAQLDVERENVLAAHRWCDSDGRGAESGLRLVHAVKPYWAIRGALELGYRITVEALARCDRNDATSTHAQGLFNAGQLALWMGRYTEAHDYLGRSLAIARVIGDHARVARALQPLGAVALALGDREHGRRCLEEALTLAQSQGNAREIAAAMIALAQLHRMEGDFDTAEPLYADALKRGQDLGDREIVAVALLNLTMVAIAQGARGVAVSRLREVIAIAEEIGSKSAGQSVLEVCAGLASVSQAWSAAARFFGMAEAQASYSGIRRDAADEAFLGPLMDKAKRALGGDAFSGAETGGRKLGYEAAIGEAKAWLQQAD